MRMVLTLSLRFILICLLMLSACTGNVQDFYPEAPSSTAIDPKSSPPALAAGKPPNLFSDGEAGMSSEPSDVWV